jgi:flagellar hook-length control protein FliK
MRETNEAPSDQPLDPMPEPAIEVVDREGEKQKDTPDQAYRAERQAVTAQRTTEGGEQASQVAQELARLDAAGSDLDRVVEQSVGQKPVEGTGQPHVDPRPQFFSHDGEGSIGKAMPIAPHGLQAGTDSGQSSDLLWSNQDERQSGSREHPWTSPAPMVPSQSDLPGEYSAQAMVAGSAASPQPRPLEGHPVSSAGAASSVWPAHELEPFMPTMSRSVVFEIAEPDLGRINIRVAMTNELVHAHLLSDRSDVGQFLLNGQDRLQSALQSNGLEMGQFRVDIDRQGAGRSFQQGSSQEQHRMWQQASDGGPRDAGYSERHHETHLSYAGRLNLVA